MRVAKNIYLTAFICFCSKDAKAHLVYPIIKICRLPDVLRFIFICYSSVTRVSRDKRFVKRVRRDYVRHEPLSNRKHYSSAVFSTPSFSDRKIHLVLRPIRSIYFYALKRHDHKPTRNSLLLDQYCVNHFK